MARREKSQYEKYKPDFSTCCVLNIIAILLSVVSVVCLLFVPIYDLVIIPNLLEETYSFYDAIVEIISRGTVLSIIIRIECYAFAIGMGIDFIRLFIMFIKNIAHLIGLDNYSLEEYDKIKQHYHKRRWGRTGPASFLFLGIFLEIILIIAIQFMIDDDEIYLVTIISLKTINWYIIFPILLSLTCFILSLIAWLKYRKVKFTILKEDYDDDYDDEEEDDDDDDYDDDNY